MTDNFSNVNNNMVNSAEIISPQISGKHYTKPEVYLAFFAVAFGYLFIKLCIAGLLGAGATLFFLIFIAVSSVTIKKCGVKQSARSIKLMLISAVFSCYFIVSANMLTKTLNLIFVLLLLTLWVFSINNGGYKGANDNFPYTVGKALFGEPLNNFGECSHTISFSLSKSRSGKNLKFIFIGLIIAVPATLTATLLLISADGFFSDMMNKFFSNIGNKILVNGFQFAIGIPVAFYIFGMIFAALRNKTQNKINEEDCIRFTNKLKIANSIIISSSVIPLCFVYVLFFLSQINYFVSAFLGKLPEEYNLSEYARRGFFELCFIAVINLIIIIIINILCKSNVEKSDRPKSLKFFTVLLSVFTLILIATAVSKMILYIDSFGLTRLRVYTTWFMILLFMIFILIIFRQFLKINIAKIGSVIFIIMFTVLTFCNVDSFILKYNYYAYQSGYINDFDISIINELSNDSYYAASSILNKSESSASETIQEQLKNQNCQSYFDIDDLRTFNFPDYFAHKNSDNLSYSSTVSTL